MALLRVNPPVDIKFAGFKCNTYILGACGWDISFEIDTWNRMTRALLYRGEGDIKLMAECSKFDMMRFRDMEFHRQQPQLPVFTVRSAFSTYIIRDMSLPSFTSWADLKPKMVEVETGDILNTPLFLSKQHRTQQEIIVEPKEVQEILDELMQRQSTKQAEIRARRRKEEKLPVAMATILSFNS